MKPEAAPAGWWELHLRHARGEQLSEAERRVYEAELARQDHEAPPLANVEALRELRASADGLAQENAHLRQRVEQLQTEIRAAEQALSRQTRDLLGATE